MPKKITRILAVLLSFLLIFEQSGFAQVANQLDISGRITGLHQTLFPEKFRPLHLRYLSYDSINNNFKLLLDKGDKFKGQSPSGTVPEIKGTTKELLNYFFVGVTLPNDTFWVNLRPDSADRIIDDKLAQTDVGKILLEADLQLKKDTAKFTSPETPEGKEYWTKLYDKAGELFGTQNVSFPTLTRPWIVPDEIIIRESNDSAYVYKATLKVLLEQDYLKGSAVYNFPDEKSKALNEYSSQLIRELIIPKLNREINSSKRYAPLRQVYYSLILAQWFKSRHYGKGGQYSSTIDQGNLTGLTSKTAWSKTTYFQDYQKSFKDGEYKIQEPVNTLFGQSIRTYFSGGIKLDVGIQASSSLAAGQAVTFGPVTIIGAGDRILGAALKESNNNIGVTVNGDVINVGSIPVERIVSSPAVATTVSPATAVERAEPTQAAKTQNASSPIVAKELSVIKLKKITQQSILVFLMTARTPQFPDLRSFLLRDQAQAYITAGRFNEAQPVIENIVDSAIKSQAFSALGQAYAAAGRQNEADEAFRQAEQSIKNILNPRDFYQKYQALVFYAKALAKAGRQKEADKAFKQIVPKAINESKDQFTFISNQERIRAFSDLGQALAKAGRQDEADKVFEFIKDIGTNRAEQSQAFSALGQAYVAAGRQNEADEAFRQARQLIRIPFQARLVDGEAWLFLVQALAAAGRFNQVIQAIEVLRYPYRKALQSQAFSALGQAYVAVDSQDEADEAFKQAEKIIEELPDDDYEEVEARFALNQAYAAAGRFDQAMQAIENITNRNFPNRDLSLKALNSLLQALVIAGGLNETIANEAESEINTVSDKLVELTGSKKEIIASMFLILLSRDFTLDSLREKGLWDRLIRFIHQSASNIANNKAFLSTLTMDNAKSQFDLINEYFNKFETSLYLPNLFARFVELQGEARKQLVDNYKKYYASFVRGVEPDEGLLDADIVEEIHISVVGSTNLTPETYHATLSRFKSERIPKPNFTTTFNLVSAKGELELSGLTAGEQSFIQNNIKYLKAISQKRPPELLSEILANLYSVYLRANPANLPASLRDTVLQLKQNPAITQELAKQNKDVNIDVLKEEITRYLTSSEAIDYVSIFKDIVSRAQKHPQGKPIRKQIEASLNNMVALSFILQPRLRQRLNSLSAEGPVSPETILTLKEALAEIKPEAQTDLRKTIDEVSGLDKLNQIIKDRLVDKTGEGVIELSFIPAKTKLDYFYGYFGENCTSNNPEELLNPAFTPIRILRNGKIVGAIHTLTLNIDGKKSLVICGIEPQAPLANELDAEVFVKGLLDKLTTQVAQKNGYEQVLLSTSDATVSNRTQIAEAIKKLIQDKPDIPQSVQPTFPRQTGYSITDLKLWVEVKASSPLAQQPQAGVSSPVLPRLVANADIHGEFDGFIENLRKAGIIDEQGRWIGGKSVFVQLGDVIDRGPKSIEAFRFLQRLQKEAREAGGEVIRLLGNHELMLLEGDFRYANFSDPQGLAEEIRKDILSGNIKAAYVFGDRLFVHGGLRSKIREMLKDEVAQAKHISKNDITLKDIAERLNQILIEAVPSNNFNHAIFQADSARGGRAEVAGIFWNDFQDLLDSRGANEVRQIVGHTPERKKGAKGRWSDSVGRIDIDAGLFGGYGGNQAFLVIEEGQITIVSKDRQEGWQEEVLEKTTPDEQIGQQPEELSPREEELFKLYITRGVIAPAGEEEYYVDSNWPNGALGLTNQFEYCESKRKALSAAQVAVSPEKLGASSPAEVRDINAIKSNIYKAADLLFSHIMNANTKKVKEILDNAEKLLLSARGYENNLLDEDKLALELVNNNLMRHREANNFELKVQAIAQQSGRPYFDMGDSLFPGGDSVRFYNPHIAGHATNYDALFDIIFKSNGILMGNSSLALYFNKGREGQFARVRINSKPGVVSLVFDLDSLLRNGTRFDAYAEFFTNDWIPLRYLVKESKIHIWYTIQNILEAKGIPFDGEMKQKVIRVLGYNSETELMIALGLTQENAASSAEAGVVSSSLAQPQPSASSPLTRMSTRSQRLDSGLGAITALLRPSGIQKLLGRVMGKPTVYDIGVGWDIREGPVTTSELARSLGNNANVVGIDSQIPAYLIETKSGKALFDESDNLLSLLTDDQGFIYETGDKLSVDVRDRYTKLAKSLKGNLNSKESSATEYSDGSGNKIILNPLEKYIAKNLTFARGDLFNLSEVRKRQNLPQADIVRIANVLIPHYTAEDIERALRSLMPVVKKDGYVFIGYSNMQAYPGEDYLVYRKRGNRFVLENYAFSVNTKKVITFGAANGSHIGDKFIESPGQKMHIALVRPMKDWVNEKKYSAYLRDGMEPYWGKYDRDTAAAKYNEDAQYYAREIAGLLAKDLRSEGIGSEAMDTIVMVKIEPPEATQSAIKREFMQAIKEGYLDIGVPSVVEENIETQKPDSVVEGTRGEVISYSPAASSPVKDKVPSADISSLVDSSEIEEIKTKEFAGRVIPSAGQEYWEKWNPESVKDYTMEDYTHAWRESSGHFAVHIISPSLAKDVISRGYLTPRVITEAQEGISRRKNDPYSTDQLVLPSYGLHFSVDKAYQVDTKEVWKGGPGIAFVSTVEALMENKAFMYSPFIEDPHTKEVKPSDDWPVTGFSDNIFDRSHRFYFDELGILFIPKTQQADFENFFSNTNIRPKRVYFYSGKTIQEGINNFLKEYGITPNGQPRVSGELVSIRESGRLGNSGGNYRTGTGQGLLFASMASWSPAYRQEPQLVDVPQTAQDYAQIAQNLISIRKRTLLDEYNKLDALALSMVEEAFKLDPHLGKAHFVKGLILQKGYALPYNHPEGSIDTVINYLAKGVELGLSKEDERVAQHLLSELYPQIDEFNKARNALERLQALVEFGTDSDHTNFNSGILTELDSISRREKDVQAFQGRLKDAKSLDEFAQVIIEAYSASKPNSGFETGYYNADLLMMSRAFKQAKFRFVDMAQREAERLVDDYITKEKELGEALLVNSAQGIDIRDADFYLQGIQFLEATQQHLEALRHIPSRVVLRNYNSEALLDRINQFKLRVEQLRKDIAKIGDLDHVIDIVQSRIRAETELASELATLEKELSKPDINFGNLKDYYLEATLGLENLASLIRHAAQLGADVNKVEGWKLQFKRLADIARNRIKEIQAATKLHQRLLVRLSGKYPSIPEDIFQFDFASSPLAQQPPQPGVSSSVKLSPYKAEIFVYDGPIEIQLAGKSSFFIYSAEDLRKLYPRTVNTVGNESGYFLVDPSGHGSPLRIGLREKLVIGRNNPNFNFPAYVSREHAQIEQIEENKFSIQDLDSRNGTAVNMQRGILGQEGIIAIINALNGGNFKMIQLAIEDAIDEIFNTTISQKSQPDSGLLDAATRESWQQLIDEFGSIDKVRRVSIDKFIKAVGAKEIRDIRGPWTLPEEALQLVEKVRQMMGGADIVWNKILSAMQKYRAYKAPEVMDSILTPHITIFHPRVTEIGIYYSRDDFERLGVPLTKSVFFHELLEMKFAEKGAVDPIFRRFFFHANPLIVAEELKFASEVGELGIRLEVWRDYIKRLRNIYSGNQNIPQEQINVYFAQLGEIINKYADRKGASSPASPNNEINDFSPRVVRSQGYLRAKGVLKNREAISADTEQQFILGNLYFNNELKEANKRILWFYHPETRVKYSLSIIPQQNSQEAVFYIFAHYPSGNVFSGYTRGLFGTSEIMVKGDIPDELVKFINFVQAHMDSSDISLSSGFSYNNPPSEPDVTGTMREGTREINFERYRDPNGRIELKSGLERLTVKLSPVTHNSKEETDTSLFTDAEKELFFQNNFFDENKNYRGRLPQFVEIIKETLAREGGSFGNILDLGAGDRPFSAYFVDKNDRVLAFDLGAPEEIHEIGNIMWLRHDVQELNKLPEEKKAKIEEFLNKGTGNTKPDLWANFRTVLISNLLNYVNAKELLGQVGNMVAPGTIVIIQNNIKGGDPQAFSAEGVRSNKELIEAFDPRQFNLRFVYGFKDNSGKDPMVVNIDAGESQLKPFTLEEAKNFNGALYLLLERIPSEGELGVITTVPSPLGAKPASASSVAEEKKAGASSPVEQTSDKGGIDASTSLSIDSQKNKKGGIDFRALPIVTQPIVPLSGAVPNLFRDSPLRGQSLSEAVSATDSEWLQIQNMIQAGIIPSTDRIKQYLQACFQNGSADKDIDKVLACIADILRMEEERCCETEPSLKNILALLESGKNGKDLVIVLSNIEVLAKEPEIIEE